MSNTDNNIVGKKKLSYNIERVKVEGFNCFYEYKFNTNLWLDNIPDFDGFGISKNELRETVIENLIIEFRTSLNNVLYGDPAGKEYIENINKLK